MRTALIGLLRRHRVSVLLAVDLGAWILATTVAVALRLESPRVVPEWWLVDAGGNIPGFGVLAVALSGGALHSLMAWLLRLNQGRHTTGSFEEIFGIATVVIVAGSAVALANALVPGQFVPRTSTAVAVCLAFLFCAWPRALWRVLVHQPRPSRRREGPPLRPVLIAGAGEAGRDLVRSMHRDPDREWDPVAYLDDDPRKRHFRYRGVSTLGPTADLARVAASTGADDVVIAMPSADSSIIGRIYELGREAGLHVKVLPGVHALLDGVSTADVRDVEPSDLLGRHQIETDLSTIAGYLSGRRILVTGAGGSIGSELCRQVSRLGPARLVMLDRDESALHALTLDLRGRADLESPDCVLADIRDRDRIRRVFAEHRPEVVFHAAALKHVNMLEQHPAEAIKTNVEGTAHVLEAAAEVGVGRFVNISTDKAADPCNALGYSKRIAEALTAAWGQRTLGTFLSVRFGNVLGTRGSVLTTFAAQIRAGGPVTVTDPQVTRYFMTVDEAVQLVIQAAAIGDDGEALILDMGEPVRIAEVARRMIEQSGRPIEIVYTGLKPGEKLHEVLLGSGEPDQRPCHPLVSHVRVPGLYDIDHLHAVAGRTAAIDALSLTCSMAAPDRARVPSGGA